MIVQAWLGPISAKKVEMGHATQAQQIWTSGGTTVLQYLGLRDNLDVASCGLNEMNSMDE